MRRHVVRTAALLALIAVAALVAPRPASAFCFFHCSYAKTKYPIVLAHGASGFDSLFGVLDY